MPEFRDTAAKAVIEGERKLAAALARQTLSDADYEVWKASTYTKRFHLFGDDGLDLVLVADGEEVDVIRYLEPQLSANFAEGLKLRLISDDHILTLTHKPTRIPGTDTFAWIPPFRPDLRYMFAGAEGTYRVSVNVVYRSPLPPTVKQGHTEYLRIASK